MEALRCRTSNWSTLSATVATPRYEIPENLISVRSHDDRSRSKVRRPARRCWTWRSLRSRSPSSPSASRWLRPASDHVARCTWTRSLRPFHFCFMTRRSPPSREPARRSPPLGPTWRCPRPHHCGDCRRFYAHGRERRSTRVRRPARSDRGRPSFRLRLAPRNDGERPLVGDLLATS